MGIARNAFALSFAWLALGASPARAEAPSFDAGQYPSQLSVTRYETDDLNTIKRVLYDAGAAGDGYVPRNTHHTIALAPTAAECVAQVLREQQAFSLGVMMKRLNYTPEMVEEQKGIGTSLRHDQVLFLENNRLVPHSQWKGAWGPAHVDEMSTYAGEDHDHVRVKTGALWTIAGQVLGPDRTRLDVVPVRLPWQSEPGMDEIAARHLDRRKIKFLSEWGRAAQIQKGEIDPLFSAAAAADYQRVRAMGGQLKDAWVMIDSDRPANIKLYESWFPGTRFPPQNDPHAPKRANTLFLVPLEAIMKRFPPRQHLQRVAKIVELSGGHLSDADALDLLSHRRVLLSDELNFMTPRHGQQRQPLLIRDFSDASVYAHLEMFKRFGVPRENQEELMRYLFQFRRPSAARDIGQYPDAADESSYFNLTETNSIEVSNLNGDVAGQDPDFVRATLLSTYAFYIKKYFGGTFPPLDHIEALLNGMHQNGVNFAITTTDARVIRQAQALGPVTALPRHILASQEPPNVYREGYSFLFTVPQIMKLIAQTPDEFREYCQQAIQPMGMRAHDLLQAADPF